VEEQAPLRQQPGAPQQDGRLATQPAIIGSTRRPTHDGMFST
jgi:hypothetical protein